MTATLVVPSALRQQAGGARQLEVDGATLGEVLDGLARRLPVLERRLRDERGELRRHVLVFVDGMMVRGRSALETPVGESSELIVAPAVSGG